MHFNVSALHSIENRLSTTLIFFGFLLQAFTMCRHLERWGLGTLIPAVTSDRKYKVNPRAPTNAALKVTKTFNSVFQAALREASKFLESEIEKLEKEGNHETLMLNQPESDNQKLIRTAKDRLNSSDDSHTSEVLKVPRSSSTSRTFNMPYSTSPPRVPHIPSKSMFNFSHLNNPNALKNVASSSIGHSDSNDVCDDYTSSKIDNKIKIMNKNNTALSFNTHNNEKLNPLPNSDNTTGTSYNQKPCKISVEFSLPSVLAVFDGNRTLEQAIRKLPAPLQPYGVDITVWLLR